MQRKILNVYLYRDNESIIPRFKMRMIEMQTVDAFPPELDNTFLECFAGIEPPFALCLSDELDKYNTAPLNKSSKSMKEPGLLFRALSDGYTREVMRDDQKCYIYQDIDLLLFAEAPSAADESYKGNDHDLLQTLAVVDDAITAFSKNAASDNYKLSIHFCDHIPDFSHKMDILRDAVTTNHIHTSQSLSRHIVNWLINTIHDPQIADKLSPSTIEMADHMLSPLLTASEGTDSLNIAVRSKLSMVRPGGVDTPRPLRSSFFADKVARSKRDIELVESEIASLTLN